MLKKIINFIKKLFGFKQRTTNNEQQTTNTKHLTINKKPYTPALRPNSTVRTGGATNTKKLLEKITLETKAQFEKWKTNPYKSSTVPFKRKKSRKLRIYKNHYWLGEVRIDGKMEYLYQKKPNYSNV